MTTQTQPSGPVAPPDGPASIAALYPTVLEFLVGDAGRWTPGDRPRADSGPCACPELGTGIRILDLLVHDSFEAAILASNPNLVRSLQIEDDKNECIEKILCDRAEETSWVSGPEGEECRFNWWDVVRDCGLQFPSLADKKVVVRHLEAEVNTGHLRKGRDERGKTEYVYRSRERTPGTR